MIEQARRGAAAPAPKPELPAYAAADFEKNLPQWRSIVESGRKTASALLATLSTKATFNDEQRAVILGLGVIQQEPAPAPDPAATPAPAADDFVADMEAAEGAK